ncbi:MAG TPA: hybrid sensor histidine kinase/response regulator, partial [Phycisphaerae bacterium]|nr:hybrid sensor histidine kinase/response regulator [Phycisphaerae bacterium]
ELERLQRQRLEEISQIKTNVLSMVSHDLRTPLTSIHLYAQMLEEDLKDLDEGEQRKFLGVISEECTRLSRLVDDLLEVQRLERNNIDWPTQPHDLSETVRSVARAFEPIALNNGLQFDVQCPEKIMQVWVNPDKIAQAINNLLSNALKFTPSGGRIILAARFTNAEVVISVADTGPGIPREKWDAVFDRFVQISSDKVAASKGVGLGLYITRQIIERHKGRVWLDSEIGSGTEFFLALPICRTKPSSALVATPEYVAGQVVICDADPDLASVMAQELRGHGFEVRLAHCGSRFFEQIAERPPDVVICDVVLPDMSCQEFLDGLERVESRSFLLVLHSTGGTCEELKRLGANIVLSRPVSRSELVEAAGIAMYKRADRGAVVAMITGWGIDGDRMGQVLAAKGHLPVAVGDQTEAIESLRKYPVDAVIAFVGPEGAQSPKRHALECELPAGGHLFALTSIPDKSICQRDSTDAVTLLPYRPGQEELVAAEIDRLVGARKAEIVQ